MDKKVKISAIPAFADNYLWLIHNDSDAIVVDPGDASPVLTTLTQQGLKLAAILLTHHHNDHIGGVAELVEKTSALVYGPNDARISGIDRFCDAGQAIGITALNLSFEILAVPGHTLSHLAYYCAELGALFPGDTLFAAGCGRLFEGSPTQMLASLKQCCELPDSTQIYPAHEYTLSNLKFALATEPDNADIAYRFKEVSDLRARNQITLPSTLALELKTNPFLRAHVAGLQANLVATGKLERSELGNELASFTALRLWKNSF